MKDRLNDKTNSESSSILGEAPIQSNFDPVYVTKTSLPPIEEFVEKLKIIWKSGIVTNNGPMVIELEDRLKKLTNRKHCFFVSNGTIAIQLAIKALELSGEILTTPFTYVATSTSILWEKCTPVSVDIDPNSLCLDPVDLLKKISSKTVAILPVHVYGNPCDVNFLSDISKTYQLPIIYDGAHAVGASLNGKPLLAFGDVSTAIFHATKLFSTVEGGAVYTDDDDVAAKLNLLRSFGHKADEYYSEGINGKNSEFHAAMGLCNLPRISSFIEKRKEVFEVYDSYLSDLPVRRVQGNVPGLSSNYAYYPVLFENELKLQKTRIFLEENGVFTRRYFFPSLNLLPYLNPSYCPVAEDISKRVLCLPLSSSLEKKTVERVGDLFRSQFR